MELDTGDEQARLLARIRSTVEGAARREWADRLGQTAGAQVEFQSSVLACVELLADQVREIVETLRQQHEQASASAAAAQEAAAAHAGDRARIDRELQELQSARQEPSAGQTAVTHQLAEAALSARVQRLADAERALDRCQDLEQRVSSLSSRIDARFDELRLAGLGRPGVEELSIGLAERLDAHLRHADDRARKDRRRLRKQLERLQGHLDALVGAEEAAIDVPTPPAEPFRRVEPGAGTAARPAAGAARHGARASMDGARAAGGSRADVGERSHETPRR